MADWLYPFLTAPVVTTASAIADVAEEAINALKGTFILVVLALNAGTMNFATGGMFNFPRSTHTVGKRIRIIRHSQGTIITSNAVDSWSWFASSAVPPVAPPPRTAIYVLAGAIPLWPPGVNLKFFTNSEDAIPLFSLGSSYDPNVLAVWPRPAPADSGRVGRHRVGHHQRDGGARDQRVSTGSILARPPASSPDASAPSGSACARSPGWRASRLQPYCSGYS